MSDCEERGEGVDEGVNPEEKPLSSSKVEVLLEYGSSRVVFSSFPSAICEAIQAQLLPLGVVTTVKLSTAADCGGNKDLVLVQRYDERWKVFVNIVNAEEIRDGDRLTVVSKPMVSDLCKSKHQWW